MIEIKEPQIQIVGGPEVTKLNENLELRLLLARISFEALASSQRLIDTSYGFENVVVAPDFTEIEPLLPSKRGGTIHILGRHYLNEGFLPFWTTDQRLGLATPARNSYQVIGDTERPILIEDSKDTPLIRQMVDAVWHDRTMQGH